MAVDEPNKSEEIHVVASSAHKVTGARTPTDEDVSLALIPTIAQWILNDVYLSKTE